MPNKSVKSSVKVQKSSPMKKAKSPNAKSKQPSRSEKAVKLKAVNKPTHKPQVKKQHPSSSPKAPQGFMWKLLEQKKQKQMTKPQPVNPFERETKEDTHLHEREQRFVKFAGPRRKVG